MPMKKPEYRIKNVDRLDPFLMSLTSSDNHWMFISSNGALTAGREKADHALFPYITDNLIHTSLNTTGPKTKINIYKNNEKINTWSPLSYLPTKHNVQKNLYKDALEDNILYEEINKDLKLSFRYQWLTSRKFGFIKKTELVNESEEEFEFEIIDGLQNILPSGLDVQTQQSLSNLSNAYKHSEIIQDTNLAIFSLGSLIMDRPDPGEANPSFDDELKDAKERAARSNILFDGGIMVPITSVLEADPPAVIPSPIPNPFAPEPEPIIPDGAFFENNILIDAMEESGGRGLAGAITSLDFAWNEAPWEVDPELGRAPKYVKVTLSFSPIHDEPLGLTEEGALRSAAYPVGKTIEKIMGKRYQRRTDVISNTQLQERLQEVQAKLAQAEAGSGGELPS